jgi:hypothetical protein
VAAAWRRRGGGGEAAVQAAEAAAIIYGSVGRGGMAVAAAAWARQQLRRRGWGRPRLHNICRRGLACGGREELERIARERHFDGNFRAFLDVKSRARSTC